MNKGIKHINEYELLEKLGNGSFGKVYKVIRSFFDDDQKIVKAEYAMKIFNKTALSNQRQILYLTPTESKMISSLDHVFYHIFFIMN